MDTTSTVEEGAANMINSRFWFDMYQRLKDEMQAERRAYLEQ